MDFVEKVRRAFGRVVLRLTLARWLRAHVPYDVQQKRVATFGKLARVPRGTQVDLIDVGGVPVEKTVLGTPHPDRAIIHVHSGGYTTNRARGQRPLSALLSRAAAAPVFNVDYRLAPQHPYPAAYDDVRAVWDALVAEGYEPGSIVLSGDSAGAGLALGIAQRLRDEGAGLPAALLLMSPYLDLSHSGETIKANLGRDYLDDGWGEANAAAFAPHHDHTDPAVSPLFGEMQGLPPMQIQSAGRDILLSDAERLEERARAAGVEVAHRREPEIWHDFQAMPDLSGAAGDALRDAGEFARRAWEGRPHPPSNGGGPRGAGPRVAIVGAGFGGVALALELKKAGIEDFTIYERGEGFGGTWLANSYPGAACDVPGRLYSLAAEPNHEWSRRYAPQPEILAYLGRVAEKHGLTSHLRANTEIACATFDEGRGVWSLETTGGQSHEADLLVTACGQLSRPSIPAIPGLESFGGEAFHSAEWNHDFDLTGKNVAVIGTGASAIQFVPEIAKEAGRLEVFQRSAPYVIPRMDPEYGRIANGLHRFPPWRHLARFGLWAPIEFFGTGFGPSQWPLTPLKLMASRNLRKEIPAGPLRDALAPNDKIGCKRVLLSSDYYPAFLRPNVDLVTAGIERITESGVRTVDGEEHPADAIIWGTGFRTNDFLTPMRVVGRGGAELNETWKQGARAYLGMGVSGFPNFQIMYGPNTNQGSGSIVHILETQAAYIAEMARALAREPGTRFDVRPEVLEEFDADMQEHLGRAVWSTGCHNWYVDENGRNSNNWHSTTGSYRRRVGRFDPADYAVA